MKIILFIIQRLIIKQSLNKPYKDDTNMAQQQLRDNELLQTSYYGHFITIPISIKNSWIILPSVTIKIHWIICFSIEIIINPKSYHESTILLITIIIAILITIQIWI